MIPIFVCEDENNIRREIVKQIKNHIMIENYDMVLEYDTENPEKLLEKINKNPRRGIYFLDVDLKNETYDGFLLGKELRKVDSRGFLVYVTAHQDLAFHTFRYHLEALDYIVKDNPEHVLDGIRRCIDTIAERLSEEAKDGNQQFYSVKIMDSVKHIPVSDIIFFETAGRNHRIILYTEQERIDFIGKLQEIQDELGEDFIRTHRSYLVNYNKISELNVKRNEIIMEGGITCLMSRSIKSELVKRIKANS